jgi:PAS domain S-box-containing protein
VEDVDTTANIAPQAPLTLIDRLQESEERFRTMADSAPVLLWMADTDGLCSFFNQGWLAFTGRPLEREIGNGWAEGVHPEDFQDCMDVYMSAFVRRADFRMEYRLRRADGEYRWVLDQGRPRYTPAGAFAGYIGSCVDITDFKDAHDALRRFNVELERRVQERTADLTRSNTELEQFAFAVSHDLQEPLRMISSYVRLLELRYKSQLDAEADDFINFAVDGAERMQRLIRDLLAYAGLRREESPPTWVDCAEVLGHAVHDLQQVVEDTGASVVIETLPTVWADGSQLARLFQNLIQNALRFHGEQPPVVRVRSERRIGEWLFTVSDNGIGIDPRHAERIFRIFQRLHSRTEYPGTGIGLSICKRIVERWGGRIWVESELGRGATFSFTLPDHPDTPASGDTREAGPR